MYIYYRWTHKIFGMGENANVLSGRKGDVVEAGRRGCGSGGGTDHWDGRGGGGEGKMI